MSRRISICAVAGCNNHAQGRHCDQHAVNLPSVYGRFWRTRIRPAVLARDGYRCHYCNKPGTIDEPLAVAHLEQTSELLRQGSNIYDISRMVSAHQTCHNRNAPHRGRPIFCVGGSLG